MLQTADVQLRIMTLCDATSCVVDDSRESTVTTLNVLQLLNTNREYSSWYTRPAAVLDKAEEEIRVNTDETRIVTPDAYRICKATSRILKKLLSLTIEIYIPL